MSNGKRKGNAFERKIAVSLSLWLSHGERDDLIWRTASSGGRATNRRKQNKNTSGQYGDLCATDPLANDLFKVFTIELKRGASSFTVMDLLDKPKKAAKQKYEEWFQQAQEEQIGANTLSWLLVVKRDKREPIVFLPLRFMDVLAFNPHYVPQLTMRATSLKETVMGITLEDFLKKVKPDFTSLLGKK
jgi:hypothetical protein